MKQLTECELRGPLTEEEVEAVAEFEKFELNSYRKAEAIAKHEHDVLQNAIELARSNPDFGLVLFNAIMIALATKSDELAVRMNMYLRGDRAANMVVFYHTLSHFKTVEDIFKTMLDSFPKVTPQEH